MTASTQPIHADPHPLAGQTIPIAIAGIGTGDFVIEDWWDRVSGSSWAAAPGNPAAMKYAARSGPADSIPFDDEVVYGKFGAFGHLVHVSELPAPF
ncbi:hypothetical protein [Rhodococcus rhodochrous]|uniref:hypothetical protein n=1 Tax=Rhodococcus rhodochrous TaxID=1829 RepID=UPI00177DC8B9|nr:hypothetical protein [Rhodococcus rhodochrous]QOH59920.1 hypothetical protein C6Y44_27930 [Rhodococcus rhodochrous]